MSAQVVPELTAAERRISAAAEALGDALDAVDVYVEPAISRAKQAEHNLYDRIDAEFGLLTGTEMGRLLGSRSTAPRNHAGVMRREGRLLALKRGHALLYPAFQVAPDGIPLPVIQELRQLASEAGWSEASLTQWLCSPSTYLTGDKRPVDLLVADPEAVLHAAGQAWNIQW